MTTKAPVAEPRLDCPGKVLRGWIRWTFIVLPDLSGPDPRVREGTAGALRDHFPVIYKGETLFIGETGISYAGNKILEGALDVFKDFPGSGVEGGVCNLKFAKPNGRMDK
jgi:hypothetical protein